MCFEYFLSLLHDSIPAPIPRVRKKNKKERNGKDRTGSCGPFRFEEVIYETRCRPVACLLYDGMLKYN